MTDGMCSPEAPPLRVLRLMDKLGYGAHLHGPGRMWLHTLPAFDPHRSHVVACVLRGHPAIVEQFRQRGVEIRDLRKGRFDPTTVWALYRIIRRERIDLVHAHGMGSTTCARLAGWVARVPVIVHQHDRMARAPWFVRVCDRLLAGRTAAAIAVSRALASACAQRRHIPWSRITILPNAIDPEWARAADGETVRRTRERAGVPADALVIGVVSRLRHEKNVGAVLDAVARLRGRHPAWLVIVGDGPDRPRLEAEARRLGIERTTRFVGLQADVRPWLSAMDIVAFAERTQGSPNALLEAMAMGRPVAAVDSGGLGELVRDGRTGVLAPPDSPQGLADALARLIERPLTALQLGRHARADVLSRHSVVRYVDQLQALYEAVARRAEAPVESSAPPVSIVIVAYNLGSRLARTLWAVRALRYPLYEVIVVDDGSTDQTAAVAEAFSVRLIRHARNRGRAEARNSGARAARYPLLYLLDGDCAPRPDALRRLVDGLLADPGLGIVAGSYETESAGRSLAGLVYDVAERFRDLRRMPRAYPYVTVANSLMRRVVFDALGGFNPDFPRLQDYEFTYRAHRLGWRNIHDPRVTAVHHTHRTTLRSYFGHVYWIGAHGTRLRLRYRPEAPFSRWLVPDWRLFALLSPAYWMLFTGKIVAENVRGGRIWTLLVTLPWIAASRVAYTAGCIRGARMASTEGGPGAGSSRDANPKPFPTVGSRSRWVGVEGLAERRAKLPASGPLPTHAHD